LKVTAEGFLTFARGNQAFTSEQLSSHSEQVTTTEVDSDPHYEETSKRKVTFSHALTLVNH
jgi:hypothetical protein